MIGIFSFTNSMRVSFGRIPTYSPGHDKSPSSDPKVVGYDHQTGTLATQHSQ